MNIILLFTSVISAMILFSSHPVNILAIILIQTALICINTWFILSSSWMSYILFLIFLGGLMVLFVYIVSLASNEKFEPSIENLSSLIMFISFLLIIVSMFKTSPLINSSEKSLFFLMKMVFSDNIFFLTLVIMSYLLFTLIVVVKVSSMFEGPLRSTIK